MCSITRWSGLLRTRKKKFKEAGAHVPFLSFSTLGVQCDDRAIPDATGNIYKAIIINNNNKKKKNLDGKEER